MYARGFLSFFLFLPGVNFVQAQTWHNQVLITKHGSGRSLRIARQRGVRGQVQRLDKGAIVVDPGQPVVRPIRDDNLPYPIVPAEAVVAVPLAGSVAFAAEDDPSVGAGLHVKFVHLREAVAIRDKDGGGAWWHEQISRFERPAM